MAWSRNNIAHRRLDGALASLRQYQGTYLFPEAGTKKVSELKYWPAAGASPNVIKLAAGEIAEMLVGIVNQWVTGATYEDGFDETSSTKELTAVLADADKTVADLGDALDRVFDFVGEDDD